MRPPLRLYGTALRRLADGDDGRLDLVDPTGRLTEVDAAAWTSGLRPGDRALLDRCHGSTLDVGCGPGRLAAALARDGRVALGVDVCREAVWLARRQGAPALCRDVFGPLPGEGNWDSLLLVDGNIGIGGDPHRLLRRCVTLLRRGGSILAELHPPSGVSWAGAVRLRLEGELSAPFPWAAVASRDASGVAHRAGLQLRTLWTEAGRWFAHFVA